MPATDETGRVIEAQPARAAAAQDFQRRREALAANPEMREHLRRELPHVDVSHAESAGCGEEARRYTKAVEEIDVERPDTIERARRARDELLSRYRELEPDGDTSTPHERYMKAQQPGKPDGREHVRRCEEELPDIAGTAHAIRSFKAVPLKTRLDYLDARRDALYYTGSDRFEAAFDRALKAKEEMYETLRQSSALSQPPEQHSHGR